MHSSGRLLKRQLVRVPRQLAPLRVAQISQYLLLLTSLNTVLDSFLLFC